MIEALNSMDRRKLMREAEDFYYRDNGTIKEAESVVMFGGDNQVLLDCYGIWTVVHETDLLLPNELSDKDWSNIVNRIEREQLNDRD